jgi:hypothetical protein
MNKYIFLTAMICGWASAQQTGIIHKSFPTDNSPITGEEWRLKLVERLMGLPSPVKNGAVQLYGMGDEAGADVVKVLSDNPSPTASQIHSALDILHMAFSHPESVIKPENQKPQAAMFLLRYFGSISDDANVKERLAQETVFMQTAALKVEALRQKSLPQPK